MTKPLTSARKRTPSSTLPGSALSIVPGVAPLPQMLQGHWRPVTLMDTTAVGVSRLPLSSTARLLMVAEPLVSGVQLYVQLPRPVAGCQVVPPSVETSTPPTTPPTSLAVPVIVIKLPAWTLEPDVGVVIVEVGWNCVSRS